MFERARKMENLHILFWLGKDISWCLEWKVLGMAMIIPTISLAIFITFITRQHRKEMYHNIAVCFWISANSLWMLGEFIGQDSLRGDAKYLFFAGLAAIIWFYVSDYFIKPKALKTN